MFEAGAYYSEHPHQCRMSSGVKGRVVVGRRAVVIPRLVALRVKRCPLGIQCTDWLEETREKESQMITITHMRVFFFSPLREDNT